MTRDTTHTATGRGARLLKLLLGIPSLLTGVGAIYVGLGSQAVVKTVMFLGIGAIIALTGIFVVLSAVQNDEVTVDTRGGSDGGGM